MSQLSFVVDLIASGASARSIMANHRISGKKLERALNSARLAKALELERRVLTAQMRFKAAAHLGAAIRGLADLAAYADRPETRRKACLALIAAATGINLASPGTRVYPEDVVATWGQIGGPEAAAVAAPFTTTPTGEVTFDDSEDVDPDYEAEEFEPEYFQEDQEEAPAPVVQIYPAAPGAPEAVLDDHGHANGSVAMPPGGDDHGQADSGAAMPPGGDDHGQADSGAAMPPIEDESGQNWQKVAESGRSASTETSQGAYSREVADLAFDDEPGARGQGGQPRRTDAHGCSVPAGLGKPRHRRGKDRARRARGRGAKAGA